MSAFNFLSGTRDGTRWCLLTLWLGSSVLISLGAHTMLPHVPQVRFYRFGVTVFMHWFWWLLAAAVIVAAVLP